MPNKSTPVVAIPTTDVRPQKKRRRPFESPAKRFLRQCRNPNHVVAMMAVDIVDYHHRREKAYECAVLERAIPAGNWTMVDAVSMHDSLDLMAMHAPDLMPLRGTKRFGTKRMTNPLAITMAMKMWKQRFGTAGKQPVYEKVLQIMRDRRNW